MTRDNGAYVKLLDPVYLVTITGPEGHRATAYVDAPNKGAAGEAVLDTLTGDGEFWPPQVTVEAVYGNHFLPEGSP